MKLEDLAEATEFCCRYGSPTMDEIQQFSSSYSKLLDKAGEKKIIPEDYALEVMHFQHKRRFFLQEMLCIHRSIILQTFSH